jgi:hypothetical protein
LDFSPAKLQRLKTRHHLNVPCLAPERTDFLQSIGIDAETTPVGIIARLEHALDRMGVLLRTPCTNVVKHQKASADR